MTTTCQICGRAIKLVRGAIADHGYQQPWLKYGTGDGSRTAKCFGSRHAPYEAAHDALDAYLPRLAGWYAQAEAAVAAYLAEPPATITYQARDAWGHPRGDERVFTRPEGFASEKPYYGPIGTYAYHYAASLQRKRQRASHLAIEIGHLEARRKAWRAAA